MAPASSEEPNNIKAWKNVSYQEVRIVEGALHSLLPKHVLGIRRHGVRSANWQPERLFLCLSHHLYSWMCGVHLYNIPDVLQVISFVFI